MKKILFMTAWVTLYLISFTSCSSSNEEDVLPQEKEKVSFRIEYIFEANNGNAMSRANSDVYTEFYNDKIKSKQLIPDDYEITFHCVDNGLSYTFSGKWSRNDMITLLEGNYTVNGSTWASGRYMQEKASLKFIQNVSITKETESITLNADYDCFLLFFNKSNISSLKINTPSLSEGIDVFTYKDNYYCFVNQPFTSYNESLKFEGERNNGSLFDINVTISNFEKGKYYFFNDVSGSFSIPPMEEGN